MTADQITAARILIAEDDDGVRDFLERALRQAGHTVRAVADGLQALEMLGRGRYDLVIADIVMPGLDGIALALKIAQDYPDTRVLMITGYAAERQRAHNLDSLIHKVIAKPFSLDEIIQAVSDALVTPARR